MPRVAFEPENKAATTNFDYPKLKLKSQERARILVGLEDPIMEYVHTLKKPQIINGVPQMEKKERRDGTSYEDHKMDFISRPLCLGDATILAEQGSDPKNCPMCKLAKDHPDFSQAPQRRYAMHVIKYRIKGGTMEIASPFSVETVVWAFGDSTFNKLVDFKSEWVDLRKHDLLLGPCKSEMFQTFDISVAAKAEWLTSEDRKQLTLQTFKGNQIPDLTIAVGSAKQRQWVEQDIQTILEAWAEVNGAVAESTSDLDTDLSDLLSSTADLNIPEASAPITDDQVDADGVLINEQPDALDGLDDLLAETPAVPVKESRPAAEAVPAVDNFDDLLANL